MRSADITGREKEILLLALEGASNVEIAARLGISHRTVETHKARALHKKGVKSIFPLINGGGSHEEDVPVEVGIAFEDAPCGYHSLGLDAVVLAMNRTELEWLGYERAEVVGRVKYPDLLTAASREIFDQVFPVFVKTGKLTDLVVDAVAKDGTIQNFLINATLVRGKDGKFLYTRSFVANLADRRKIREQEAELKRLNTLYSMVLQDQTELIARFHADGTMIYVNDVYARFFGKQSAEIIGNKWHPAAFPDDVHYVEERLKELTPDNPVVAIENRVFDGEGHVRWMQFVNRAFFDQNGQIREIQSVGRDITDRKNAEAEIQHLAHYDQLTALPNRRLFWEHLSHALSRAERTGVEIAVCYLDLDNFKPINDRYGHQAGDELLQEVASRLRNVLRAHDSVARFGGDEFVLILNGIETRQECDTILQRVVCAISEPIAIQSGLQLTITPCIGVALYPGDARDPDTLVRHSDAAMYLAKRAGGNSIRYFDKD